MLEHEGAGSGKPVVLIHAFPLSAAMWRATVRRLKRSFRVIAPDLPGFGRSARQAAPSVPEMARAVAELLDGLHIQEPVVACGLSMGGYVAFEFLRQFPERVRALALFSTRAAADTPESRQGRRKAVQTIRNGGLGAFSKAILPKLLGRTSMESRPALVRRVSRMILANRPEGVADALLAMADRADSTALLPGIRCPTLVVAGEEDGFIPVSEADAMRARIPGARLEVIPQAGHLVNLEQPERFHEALDRFLSRLSSGYKPV